MRRARQLGGCRSGFSLTDLSESLSESLTGLGEAVDAAGAARRNGGGGGAYRGAQAESGSWMRGTSLLRFLRISLPPFLLRWPEAASTAGVSE